MSSGFKRLDERIDELERRHNRLDDLVSDLAGAIMKASKLLSRDVDTFMLREENAMLMEENAKEAAKAKAAGREPHNTVIAWSGRVLTDELP